MFQPRQNHPFLEIIFEQESSDIFLQIGFRDLFLDGIPFSRLVDGHHVCLGMVPDTSSFGPLSPMVKNQYLEHLAGSVMNQFIKRVMCRKFMGAFDSLQLFDKQAKLNEKSVEIFIQMILTGFPMLAGKLKSENGVMEIMFHSFGTWTTKNEYVLPALSPRITSFDINVMEREFETLRFQAGNEHQEANHAMKAKLFSVMSSNIYGLHFAENVDDDVLKDPNKIFVAEKKVVQSNNLSYLLEKAQKEGRMKNA
jgi:hypothetical protein